jgi:hypothetical protein
MDVLVGHFQDPEEFPGLAHFCGTVSALHSTALCRVSCICHLLLCG